MLVPTPLLKEQLSRDCSSGSTNLEAQLATSNIGVDLSFARYGPGVYVATVPYNDQRDK